MSMRLRKDERTKENNRNNTYTNMYTSWRAAKNKTKKKIENTITEWKRNRNNNTQCYYITDSIPQSDSTGTDRIFSGVIRIGTTHKDFDEIQVGSDRFF